MSLEGGHKSEASKESSVVDYEDKVSLASTAVNDDSVTKPTVAKVEHACREPQCNISRKWTKSIKLIHRPINNVLLRLADHAAQHPKSYMIGTVVVSFTLVALGLSTNFHIRVDENSLFTPWGSRALQHGNWINKESGFPTTPRDLTIFVHADGRNILTKEALRRLFVATDRLRTTPGYDQLCVQSDHASKSCDLPSVTSFWNNSVTLFEETVATDDGAVRALSKLKYPDGTPVHRDTLFGRTHTANSSSLTQVFVFSTRFAIPDVQDAKSMESIILDRILSLRREWEQEPNNVYRVEIFTQRSFGDEMERAIVSDIPLVPVVFMVMAVFTCFMLYRRDRVRSRSLLGLGAVVCVLLSIMSGNGLLFIIGVPFTSMTQILPFVIFGVGLDDTFIIMGEYHRTDPSKSPEERIHDTIGAVGPSIFLTTLTSSLAFALGLISSVPSVFWLCAYAFPTLIIDFLYQVTFFVALIVLDERRIQQNRSDCLVCYTVKVDEEAGDVVNADNDYNSSVKEKRPPFVEAVMGCFAEILCKPFVKASVLILFSGLFVGCSICTFQLTQEFQFVDMLPSDSYILGHWDVIDTYGKWRLTPKVYFRNVDQSDPSIRQQMHDYVGDLTTIHAITNLPVRFWLTDFEQFVSNSTQTQALPFREQVAAFLTDPVFEKLYTDDIVLDENGDIVASRTAIILDQVSDIVIKDQIRALRDQRAVSLRQPVNQEGSDEFSFFTFHSVYFMYEFFSRTDQEVALVTIVGVIAVALIALVFIPHWTAVLFVTPLICILYLEMLGVMQFSGLHVNAVTFVTIVMSIGLLVDFLMHILLRYYESPKDTRQAKVKDTLRSMGSSILVGALSTLLGVIPLAFTSSKVFQAIFTAFIALVTLGAAHGLIVLPVLLSIFGPETLTSPSEPEESGNNELIEHTENSSWDGHDDGQEDHHET